MLNEFLIWFGWSIDNTFYPPGVAQSFWQSPLGLVCTLTLALTSLIRVAHWRSNQGFLDSLWHMAFGVTTAAGFLIGLQGSAPHHLVKTIIILMTVRGVYKAISVIRS